MSHTTVDPHYTDYGPRPTPQSDRARVREWMRRPYCDLCGPLRGRYLRRTGRDEYGPVYRCKGCDEE